MSPAFGMSATADPATLELEAGSYELEAQGEK
jgi:hypothetical protein